MKKTPGKVKRKAVSCVTKALTDCMKLAWRNPPIGKLLNEFIGDGPFCSSGVVWGMTFSRKDFMVG